MKLALAFLVVCVLSGCSQETSPISPLDPTRLTEAEILARNSVATLWTMVVADSGQCVEGAILEIIGGQAAGRSIPQTTPCDMWDGGGGATFTKLLPFVDMTLRASAPGYISQERTVQPFQGPQAAQLFVLAKQ